MVEDQGLSGLEGGLGLFDHDIAGFGRVALDEALHVDTDVVTGTSVGVLLLVHLDGEDLGCGWGGRPHRPW